MYYKYDVDGHETTFYGASLNSYMTTGGVKYKNLERPWGIYKKSIKYRKFTKIPCPEIGDPTTANQNIAGMWHGVGDAIAVTENAYGTHLICWMDDNTQSFLHGTIFVTAYMVYKDRLINPERGGTVLPATSVSISAAAKRLRSKIRSICVDTVVKNKFIYGKINSNISSISPASNLVNTSPKGAKSSQGYQSRGPR